MTERCTCSAAARQPSRVCPVHANVVRFPRTSALLEAQRVADVFSSAAVELAELTEAAHAHDAGTFRRKVRGIVAATVQLAVEAEGCES
jgi:hypothetical protein